MLMMLVAVALGGCGAVAETSAGGAPDLRRLPDWVLIVPVEEDGRSLFVGGCTMALTAAEGIETARGDARLQITSAARSGFMDVFGLSPRESGVTTTAIDRLDFKEMGLALYPEAMERSSSLDRVYVRSCLTREIWDLERVPEDGEIDGAVCSVFVRVSCDADGWERNLSETLREMRRSFESSGHGNLAELADWIDGRLPELMGGADEHDEDEAGARNR